MFDDPEAEFNVVINDEEQYSIWPVALTVPAGWQSVGVTGDKEYCLARIEALWTDIRPLSLREEMAKRNS